MLADIHTDDRLLRLKHVDIARSFVLQHCYAREGDIVLVCGTLVEGIGNPCSDIDVYVITDRYRTRSDIDLSRHHRVITPERSIVRESTDPDAVVYLIHTAVPGTSIKVDVEFRTFDEIGQTFAAIEDIFSYAVKNLFLLTKRLNEREETMIHRLYTCIPVLGAEQFATLLRKLPREKFLYLGYRWVASDFNILLDLIGAWQVNELDRAVEFARENVILQTSAYLRLLGYTNFRRKWLLSYLKQLGDEGLLSEFLALTYLWGTQDEAGKTDYLGRTLDYVDDLFRRSRPLLEALPGVPNGESALKLLREEREQVPQSNDYGRWEFQYRAKAYSEDFTPTRQLLGI